MLWSPMSLISLSEFLSLAGRRLPAGLMAAVVLVLAAACAILFGLRDNIPGWTLSSTLAVGVIVWGIWAAVFYRAGRSAEPQGVVSRQCRLFVEMLLATSLRV